MIYLHGEEEDLNKMQALLYQGPLFAKVYKIEECPLGKDYFPPVENGVFKRL